MIIYKLQPKQTKLASARFINVCLRQTVKTVYMHAFRFARVLKGETKNVEMCVYVSLRTCFQRRDENAEMCVYVSCRTCF